LKFDPPLGGHDVLEVPFLLNYDKRKYKWDKINRKKYLTQYFRWPIDQFTWRVNYSIETAFQLILAPPGGHDLPKVFFLSALSWLVLATT